MKCVWNPTNPIFTAWELWHSAFALEYIACVHEDYYGCPLAVNQ